MRVGLVGLGMMGRHHARVLRDLPGVELVGVVDPGGDRYRVGVADRLTDSLERLLESELDCCVVATPTATHEDLGIRLAEAGVATLIEKPLAETVPAAERVALAFEGRGLLGCVGHIERFNPAIQAMRERLAAGELGEVFQVATRRQGPFPGRVSDVGVILDLATHDIDLTAWVTKSGYRSVAARAAHRSGGREDLVSAVGLLDIDVVTSHLVNWLSPFKERVTVLTGERGCFVADTLTADLTFYANGTQPSQWAAMSVFRGVSEGNMVRYALPKPEPLVTELTAFLAAVAGRSDNVVTLREGLETVKVAEAVRASAAKGTTMEVSG
jgi:UDP-N-acetylglucosamine 3-dehydrogenase